MEFGGGSSSVDGATNSQEAMTPTRPTNMPSLGSQYLPVSDEAMIPKVGMVFDTLEESYEFCKEYASEAGFDVRRASQTKRDSVIKYKRFCCSQEGMRVPSNEKRKLHRKITRCDCDAMLALICIEDGKYRVTKFVETHTHPLVSPSKNHFLKGSRYIDPNAKRVLLTCGKVNLLPSKAYHILKEETGGYNRIGCTQKDLSNFQNNLRAFIKDSDAQIFVDKLESRKEYDPSFFYVIDTDEDGKLKRVFWVDRFCRKNCTLFGDVLSFDTTYRTNKYNLVFAPFTGVNHHKSCVSFGVALIANEQIDTFEWLFQIFLMAMGGVEPNLIVTDEDPKFEHSWLTLIDEFGLQENTWLDQKFKNRHEWIPAYLKDVPLAGLLRTTSRSESENAFFGRFLNHKVSLVEFWIKLESALEKQRHKENEDDHETINKLMELKTDCNIEKQVRDVFTHEAFRKFQDELHSSFFICVPKGFKEEDVVKVHIIRHSSNSKRREVRYDASNGIVSCSCKLFESEGIPCCHMLAVLRYEDVNDLPSNLVLDRWTKFVNRHIVVDLEGHVLGAPSLPNEMSNFASVAYSDFNECITLALNERCEAIIKYLRDLKKQWGSPLSKDKAQEIEDYIGSVIPGEIEIHPPNAVHTKESGKRLKDGLEKALQKRRKCGKCGQVGTGHNSRTSEGQTRA